MSETEDTKETFGSKRQNLMSPDSPTSSTTSSTITPKRDVTVAILTQEPVQNKVLVSTSTKREPNEYYGIVASNTKMMIIFDHNEQKFGKVIFKTPPPNVSEGDLGWVNSAQQTFRTFDKSSEMEKMIPTSENNLEFNELSHFLFSFVTTWKAGSRNATENDDDTTFNRYALKHLNGKDVKVWTDKEDSKQEEHKVEMVAFNQPKLTDGTIIKWARPVVKANSYQGRTTYRLIYQVTTRPGNEHDANEAMHWIDHVGGEIEYGKADFS